MSALLTTIPDAQDIFGLLRRWSPVVLTGKDAGYKSAVADPERPNIVTDEGTEDVESVALDLTDPTGRAHAAWWVLDQQKAAASPFTLLNDRERHLAVWARSGEAWNVGDIDTLARLVLRLAGRAA